MADTAVRAQIAVVGGGAALGELRAFRQAVADIGAQKATLAVDDAQAKRQLAEFRAETQRLNAMTAKVRVEANTSDAMQQLAQFKAETARINATTARARIEVDTSQADSKLDALMNRLTGGIISGAGAALGFELARGIGAAADAVIGFNGRLEQSRVAFTHLLGSEGAADQFIAQMKAFAISTPFQYEDVTKYAQRLLGVGVLAKDIIPDLTAIGDAVSATGGGTDALDHVVLALGQMRNSVHLNAQDMNQLIQANIPAWQILADKIGVTQAKVREMAEKGEISGSTAAAALISGMGERAAGLMEKQSHTFLGRLSNLKDSLQVGLADLGKENFADLSTAMDKIAGGVNSPKFKQFAGDIARDLHTATMAAEGLAAGIAKIPLPLVEAAMHAAELALAAKAVGGAIEFTTGILGLNTAAMAANAAATTADTTAVEANNVARLAGSKIGIVGGLAVAGGLAIGAKGIDDAMVASGAGALSDADLKEIDRQIAAGNATLDDMVAKQKQHLTDMQKANETFLGIPNPEKKIPDIVPIIGGTNLGRLFPTGFEPIAGPNDPAGTQGKNGGTYSDTEIEAQRRLIAGLEARKKAQGQVTDASKQTTAEAEKQVKSANEIASAGEVYLDNAKKMARYHAMGANQEDISRAVLGKTLGGEEATKDQVRIAKEHLSELETASKATQAALVAGWKQAAQDTAQAQKQAAQDVEAAWKSAASAVGSVDISKGLSTFADQAAPLKKIVDDLRALGQTSPNLTALSGIAAQFEAIAKAEDKASAAFKGYNLLLTDTDQRISQVDAFTKRVETARNEAYARKQRGTASADDLDLLAKAPSILANLAQTRSELGTRASGDVLGMAKNFTDLTKANNLYRDAVKENGGAKGIVENVTLQKDKALAEIADMEKAAHATTLKVELDAKEAMHQIEELAKDRSVNVKVHLVTPDGLPYTDNIDRAGGGDEGGISGYVRPTTIRSTGSGPYGNDTLTQGGVGGGTPVDPYLDKVIFYAKKYGLPPSVVAGLIEHESGGSPTARANEQDGTYSYGLLQANSSHSKDPRWAGINAGNVDAQLDFGVSDLASNYKKYIAQGMSPQDAQRHMIGAQFGGPGNPQLSRGQNGNGNADYVMNTEVPKYRYLDTQGGSDAHHSAAQSATWRSPVDKYQITQRPFEGFSHGTLGAYDLAAPTGTPVHGSGAGRVTESGPGTGGNAGYGNTVVVDYGNGIKARYGHLSEIDTKVGQVIDATSILGKVGSTGNSTGPHLHFEVTVNGKEVDPKSIGFNFDDPSKMGHQNTPTATQPHGASYDKSEHGQTATASGGGTNIGTRDLTQGGDQIDAIGKNAEFANRQIAVLQGYLQHLDAPGVTRVKDEMLKFAEYAKQVAEVTMPNASPAEQADVAQIATNNYAIAYAQTLSDIQNHTGDINADYATLVQLGGQVGANAVQWLQTTQQISAVTAQIKALDKSHADTVKQRAHDDKESSRAATRAGWAQQASQAGAQQAQQAAQAAQAQAWQKEQDARANAQRQEEEHWVKESRVFEDRARALEHYGTLRKQQLDEERVALEKAHGAAVSSTRAQEQLLHGKALGGDTTASVRLAIGADSTKLKDDAFTRQQKSIGDAMAAEEKLASQQKFDLESERIAAARAHEDRLAQMQDEATAASQAHQEQQAQQQEAQAAQQAAQSASSAAQSQADQEHQWQVEDTRQAEDDAYAAQKTSLEDQRTALEEQQSSVEAIAGSWDRITTDAAQIPDFMQRAIDIVRGGSSGGGAPAVDPNNPTGLGNVPGHAGGGRITTPYALVGEQGPELISAPGYSVTPAPQTAQITNHNGGDTYHITVVASGNQQTDEALVARVEKIMRDRDAKSAGRNIGMLRGAG